MISLYVYIYAVLVGCMEISASNVSNFHPPYLPRLCYISKLSGFLASWTLERAVVKGVSSRMELLFRKMGRSVQQYPQILHVGVSIEASMYRTNIWQWSYFPPNAFTR